MVRPSNGNGGDLELSALGIEAGHSENLRRNRNDLTVRQGECRKHLGENLLVPVGIVEYGGVQNETVIETGSPFRPPRRP